MSWQQPESDGGSPITGYHVERHETSSKRWIKANKEPITELTFLVPDLVEGNEYELRVMAENKVGVGPPSSPTAPFTAKDPWGMYRIVLKSFEVY